MNKKLLPYFLAAILLASPGGQTTAFGQVNVSFTITPPYSTKLSDYMSVPGKVLLTLTSAGPRSIQVFLRLEITGDNGIRVMTKPGFRPAQPIVLEPGMPLMVDIQTLSALFDVSSFDLQNITTGQIFLRNGLPEGHYQFCVRVYNYIDPIPVSPPAPSGCTQVRLTQLEPPLLVKPLDKTDQSSGDVQNLLFTWNIPAGAEPGTQYLFRVIEMLDPSKNPNDAVNARTSPVFFEVRTNSPFVLYGPGEPALVNGRRYAWYVTALPGPQGIAYRNGGRSEVRSFFYRGIPATNAKLSFVNPNEKQRYVAVNNENDFLVSWNWLDPHAPTNLISDTSYKKYGVARYEIQIGPGRNNTQKQFSFKTILQEQNGKLAQSLVLTEPKAQLAGFKNGQLYHAVVKAYDKDNQLITEAASVEFEYRSLADAEPVMKATVNAMIKYSFEGRPQQYPAAHTPVEVEVLRLYTGGAKPWQLFTFIGGKQYMHIATSTVTTKADGSLETDLTIPKKSLPTDSIYFHVKMTGAYYLSDHFAVLGAKTPANDTMLSLGQLAAKTYGYSLKLKVSRAYASYAVNNKKDALEISLDTSNMKNDYAYDEKKGMIFKSGLARPEAGITVILYRKNKKAYVPPVEGSLSGPVTSGYVEVGRGKTQIEKVNGVEAAIVTFPNLLSNIFDGDEYYVKAINEKNQVQYQLNGVSGSASFGFQEDDYVAPEMMIRIPKPKNISKPDSLYRQVHASYSIISKKPPTSLVKGKLLYKWNSDPAKQLRPYAKQDFIVIVDYLVDGRPLDYVTDLMGGQDRMSYVEKFFIPAGGGEYKDGMQLLDYGQTMGMGTTDAQGNFEIEVVNFNKKGVLGKGQVVEKGWTVNQPPPPKSSQGPQDILGINILHDAVSNPGPDAFMPAGLQGYEHIQNFNASSQVYQNFGVNGQLGFNPGNGFFELGGTNLAGGFNPEPLQGLQFGGKQSGPNAGPYNARFDGVQDDEEVLTFERVFRIVPVNFHIGSIAETMTVQPFEAKIFAPMVSNVREMQLQVLAQTEDKKPLEGMLVTVFRRLQDKPKNLPLGEGDGKYLQAELINPQYVNQDGDTKNASKLNPSSLFTTKFEHLWSAKSTALDGTVNLPALLSQYKDYYIEVCSNPLLPGKFYMATFTTPHKGKMVKLSDGKYAYQITVTLKPLPSRALLRLQDATTAKPVPSGVVMLNNNWLAVTTTDKDGYAELLATQSPLSLYLKGSNAAVSFTGKANGYKNSPPVSYTFQSVMGHQFVKNIPLGPAAFISGRIVSRDESNKPVAAYIRTSTGKVAETNSAGQFSFPIPDQAGIKLEVIPKDVAYFDSSFTLTAAMLAKSNLNDIAVYRRKHRIRIVVRDDQSDSPISNAVVQLGDVTRKTAGSLGADFIFENVSVNNYTFIVRGPQSTNYIPVTKNVVNEETKDFVTVTVRLEKGSEISGVVKLDNKPVKQAKVYIDASTQESGPIWLAQGSSAHDDANLVVAYSDANGKYTLNGVPVNNQKIRVHAVLDTSFTVNGDEQVAHIVQNKATVNLNLVSFKDMQITNVFGFPLTIEKITPFGNAGEVKVTGTIRWKKSISHFEWMEGNDILRVEDVVFKPKAIGNGQKMGEVQGSSVEIEGMATVKLRYLGKYNVKLTRNQPVLANPLSPVPLVITRQDDYGVIAGRVSIVDNSFNYPSTYINFTNKDQFYLAGYANNAISTVIAAVKSPIPIGLANSGQYQNLQSLTAAADQSLQAQAGNLSMMIVSGNTLNVNNPDNAGATANPSPVFFNVSSLAIVPSNVYHLSNASGNAISFTFIGFNATADPAKSYIAADGKIHLNINMACKVPNAQPENFTVNISDVVLDDNKVYPAGSKSPIELKLEQWTLSINDWKLSPEQGGITSSNGLIRTGRLDIPFSNFALRSDMFVMDGFKLNELKVGGGIKTLENIETVGAKVIYDAKTGSDMKPHWRFILASAGKPVAMLNNLPGVYVNGKSASVGIDYVQLLSNNENIFELKQTGELLSVNNNNSAKFRPQAISNGPDYFKLLGALNVGAPRLGDMALELVYSQKGGALTMTPGEVIAGFEGKGFVHFISGKATPEKNNIAITASTITVTGHVEEKPSKSFKIMPATFMVTNSAATKYSVIVEKGHVLPLTSNDPNAANGYKLTVENGSMNVVNGDWDILSYSGWMESTAAIAERGIQPMYLTFKVLGDVSVDGSGARMDNISTPFGPMSMVFDYAQKRLTGKLTLKDVLLATNMVSGTVETVFDPNGFYVAGGGTANVNIGNPFADGTYNLGFMIGSYPVTSPQASIWKVVTAYKMPEVKNDCYVPRMQGRLKGFYFTADRILFDKSYDFDFVLVSGYVQGRALIGMDFWANFSGATDLGVAVQVAAHAAAGLSACTGTSMSGEANAKAGVVMQYENGRFNLYGKVDISFKASIKQSLVFTTLSVDKSVSASAAAGTNGVSFSLTSGDTIPDCY